LTINFDQFWSIFPQNNLVIQVLCNWSYRNKSTDNTSTDDISTDDISTDDTSTDDISTDDTSTHLLAELLQHRPPLHRLFTTSTPLFFRRIPAALLLHLTYLLQAYFWG
jgi:hypothetical protein